MASLYKRGDTWYSDLRIGGVRKRVSLSKEKNTAQAMLGELIREQRLTRSAPRLADRNTLSLVDMSVEEFHRVVSLRRSKEQSTGTQATEKRTLAFIQETLPVEKASEITPEYLEKVKTAWIENGWVVLERSGEGKPIAVKNGSGANRYIRCMKAIMRWFEDEYKSPPQNWRRPKFYRIPNNGRRVIFYEDSERTKILQNANDAMRPVFYLGYFAGLRPGEIRTLWWENIDFEHNLIQIRSKSWMSARGKQEMWAPKKDDDKAGGAERSVPMAEPLKRYLLDLQAGGRDVRWVVTKLGGGSLRKEYMHQEWRDLCDRIKLPGCPYTLRHTFAVEYMRHGGNIYDLQHIMGHSSVTTTEIYAKFAPKKMTGVNSLPMPNLEVAA